MTTGRVTGLSLALALLIAVSTTGQSLRSLATGGRDNSLTGTEPTEHVAACRTAIDKLAAALQARLKQALADSGTVGALLACNVEAVPLTEQVSLEEGVSIGRTSLKVRNPRNAPDAWERQVLEHFARRLAQGESPTGMEEWTVQTDSLDHHTFRYMKVIVTRPLCLRCHGSRLQPEVTARIAALYPDDQATGYHVGDLRGAFTVTKPLD